MPVLSMGKTRTAVIALSAVTRGLMDEEEWGEILVEDYREGKRGLALRSGTIRGGLV
jgi:hypothetical protein